MGGLLYTTAWGGGYKQVIEWHKYVHCPHRDLIKLTRLPPASWAPTISA